MAKKSKLKIYLLGVLLAAIGLMCVSYSLGPATGNMKLNPNGAFHIASSTPEKALNAILALSKTDTNMMDCLLKKKPCTSTKPMEDYFSIFTPELVDDWAFQEAKWVSAQCHGEYIEGQNCGLNINPLTCINDSYDLLFFQTVRENDSEVIIQSAQPYHLTPTAEYQMIRYPRGLVVDRVICYDESNKFNMEE